MFREATEIIEDVNSEIVPEKEHQEKEEAISEKEIDMNLQDKQRYKD